MIVSLDFAGDTLINSISVADDGLGIDPDHLLTTLSNIGDSWKRTATKSPNGKRSLHGKRGQGRFQLCLVISCRVEHCFFDKADKKHKAFSFFGDKSRIRQFPYTAPVPTDRTDPGTTVLIHNIESPLRLPRRRQAGKRSTEEFAVSLRRIRVFPSPTAVTCSILLPHGRRRSRSNFLVLNTREKTTPLSSLSLSGKTTRSGRFTFAMKKARCWDKSIHRRRRFRFRGFISRPISSRPIFRNCTGTESLNWRHSNRRC